MRSIITLNAIHLAPKFVKLKDRHLCVSEVKLATKSSVNPRINLPVRSSTERGSVGDAGTKPIVQSITQAILQACVELITKLVTNRVTKLIVEKRRETPCVITNPTRDDCLANVNYRLRMSSGVRRASIRSVRFFSRYRAPRQPRGYCFQFFVGRWDTAKRGAREKRMEHSLIERKGERKRMMRLESRFAPWWMDHLKRIAP